MSNAVDITALARQHAPAAIVELMRTGESAATRLRAARALKGRTEVIRQVLPDQAVKISIEIVSTIERESTKRRHSK